MVIQGQTENFMCADGKFFVMYDYDEKGNAMYRQIERYLPGAPGTLGEPIEKTMARYLEELEGGRDYRWAVGSTGSLLTARYQVRSEDGELVSMLSLSGGMRKAVDGE